MSIVDDAYASRNQTEMEFLLMMVAYPLVDYLLYGLSAPSPKYRDNYLSEFPSATLSSVSVATATPPSSALQMSNHPA
ncbi:MAG: hypothetical protein LBV33_07900 [Lachnospiraceae bacterium]|jgi:hypothetical protein|nr:hypothetical protein [Lachnospiraceae bacterium]